MIRIVTPEFIADGLCAQVDPELFFPEGNNIREAKSVCRECPAQVACLEWALETDQAFGVWGGHSSIDRRRMKRRAS